MSETILPKITLDEPRTVRAPHRRWRVLLGREASAGERKDVYTYATQEERDQDAQRLANQYNERVICELWSFAHRQDELNRGWACDGTIDPRRED